MCFDALLLPTAAALPLLAREGLAGPVLRAGANAWLLVAEGAAEEVPELLRWLEWGSLSGELGLVALGAGLSVPAPAHEGQGGGGDPWEAAAWLRPPEPGREGGRLLPALTIGAIGPTRSASENAPDLVRLVDAAATECHRVLLGRQPLAFS
ncbi:hypothetical protein N566_28015 [Streptomycetaceae bacterium MP113-05]|nr:hypothetical protein N566_28015 [Streptomycetaceae bacterium MP113-05]